MLASISFAVESPRPSGLEPGRGSVRLDLAGRSSRNPDAVDGQGGRSLTRGRPDISTGSAPTLRSPAAHHRRVLFGHRHTAAAATFPAAGAASVPTTSSTAQQQARVPASAKAVAAALAKVQCRAESRSAREGGCKNFRAVVVRPRQAASAAAVILTSATDAYCQAIAEGRRARCQPVELGVVADVPLDAEERRGLCDLLDELGPSAPTLLKGWTTHDLAAHIVLRERDLIAGPVSPFLALPTIRRTASAHARSDATTSVARQWIRSGPPSGFFRIGWVRSFPNLNEFFVHHEDVRRANGMDPARCRPRWTPRCGETSPKRPLPDSTSPRAGLDVEWSATGEQLTVRAGKPTARRSGRRANSYSSSSDGNLWRRSK